MSTESEKKSSPAAKEPKKPAAKAEPAKSPEKPAAKTAAPEKTVATTVAPEKPAATPPVPEKKTTKKAVEKKKAEKKAVKKAAAKKTTKKAAKPAAKATPALIEEQSELFIEPTDVEQPAEAAPVEPHQPDGKPLHQCFMREGIPSMYVVHITPELSPVAKVGGFHAGPPGGARSSSVALSVDGSQLSRFARCSESSPVTLRTSRWKWVSIRQ